ncbi:MAG: putative LPS assembly protein LptD [Gemmatimonadota bacterium]
MSDTASWGTHLSFTSCELEEPHYHFASNNVKIIRGSFLVARPVKLYFADVPVAWLPFMVQNLEQGRSSGILTPAFSVNDIVRTSQSYSRRISNLGFYWAGTDYYDATVFMDWWSGEHVALTGSARFNWAKQFLTGGLSFREFWRESGDRQRAFNGNTQWQMSERTNLRFRASYASSSSMVRETSFDPREVVQSIDSEGGLSRRFDFGNLTLSANRKQYLTDDRVEMTLPNLSFSLTPQTFFKASPSQARFYNNITFSGSSSFRRSSSDRPEQPDTAVFKPSLADQVNTNGTISSSLSLGNFSLGGGLDFTERVVLGVPVGMLPGDTLGSDVPSLFQDQATAEAGWNASLGYQQRLIGSTTITPSLSVSSRLIRADTSSLASSFVSGPTRLSLGVNLRTDIYGFFPGFGSFDAIRHKISPGFDFSYAPKVSPTELQAQVFGSSEARPQRRLVISLNQTFEAKRKSYSTSVATGGAPGRAGPGPAQGDSLSILPGDSTGLAVDSLGVGPTMADSASGFRPPSNEQKTVLLSLRTTAMTYDFEEAKEEGDWLWGITTAMVTNTISSDYLRGLTLTMAHDLFDDKVGVTGEGGDATPSREFSPHLQSLNFGFNLDGRSLPFRILGSLLGGGGDAAGSPAGSVPATVEGEAQENPFAPSLSDEGSIIPGGSDPSSERRGGGGVRGAGGWRANLSFSMQRPRLGTQSANQMLQGSLSFNLTENWDASWRTSYDLIEGSFNDHFIQLTRNLHRWEAHFDFRKTATGNWSFRFEVALTDQEDLHFDYSQRSYQDQSGARRY